MGKLFKNVQERSWRLRSLQVSDGYGHILMTSFFFCQFKYVSNFHSKAHRNNASLFGYLRLWSHHFWLLEVLPGCPEDTWDRSTHITCCLGPKQAGWDALTLFDKETDVLESRPEVLICQLDLSRAPICSAFIQVYPKYTSYIASCFFFSLV